MPQKGEPERIDGILKRLEKKNPNLKGNLRANISRCLYEVIKDNFGKDMAEECFLYSFGKGVVTIGVNSAVMRHELQCFYSEKIREELVKKLKRVNIKKIKFVVSAKE